MHILVRADEKSLLLPDVVNLIMRVQKVICNVQTTSSHTSHDYTSLFQASSWLPSVNKTSTLRVLHQSTYTAQYPAQLTADVSHLEQPPQTYAQQHQPRIGDCRRGTVDLLLAALWESG
jgi:hypothetical protein